MDNVPYMADPSYQQQLQRVERFHDRIRNQSRSQMDYEDDLWSFFIHAWHLSDWLWEDPSLQLASKFQKKGEFQHKLFAFASIAVCHDIANRRKHYRLNNPSPQNATHKASVTVHLPAMYVIAGEPQSHLQPQQKATSDYEYKIVDLQGNEQNVLDFATELIKDWNSVITSINAGTFLP